MSWARFIQLFDDFDWDDGNWPKVAARLGPDEVEALIKSDGAIARRVIGIDHEERYVLIGLTPESRYLFVVFTFRIRDGKMLLRVISARYAHTKERVAYEKIKKALDEGDQR